MGDQSPSARMIPKFVEQTTDLCGGDSDQSDVDIAVSKQSHPAVDLISFKNQGSHTQSVATNNETDDHENAEIQTEAGGKCQNPQPSTTRNQTFTDANLGSNYDVKWIVWHERDTAIVMQNNNGPCPLIAIFNVLLLSNRINLPTSMNEINSQYMIDQIGDILLDDAPVRDHDEQLNYQHNLEDAMAVFPKLQTGIDVNVQFRSVRSFELTRELTVFDLLRIPLVHGWLPDPQDEKLSSLLSGSSYNQIVDKIISSKDSSDVAEIENGLMMEEFLQLSATQLTCHGVINILEYMQPCQLAILFRNNHFSTLYKRDTELFTLVTDRGFLHKRKIVWETLSSVMGDTHFTDCHFVTSPVESLTQLHSDNSCEVESTFETIQTPPYQDTEELDRRLAAELDKQLNPPQRPPPHPQQVHRQQQRQQQQQHLRDLRQQQVQQREQHARRSSSTWSKCTIS